MVFAHTLVAESASASVLARCGFARVAEPIDPDEGPVWRWELPWTITAGNAHDRRRLPSQQHADHPNLSARQSI
jgi:hypothetical protein